MPANKTQVTSRNALMTFYDIESLHNAFTVSTFTSRTNIVDVYYLIDSETVEAFDQLDPMTAIQRICDANPAYKDKNHAPRRIRLYDLNKVENNEALAKVMGLSDAELVNNPKQVSSYGQEFRPVCDTDPEYDPINTHPYLAGYNSANYDTTMMAIYLMETFAKLPGTTIENFRENFEPVLAKNIREHNDMLFTEKFKSYMPSYLINGDIAGGDGWNSTVYKIRKNMINTGRHIDIAAFNETQSRVGLKRLLGMEGRQILESDKLSGVNAKVTNLDEFYDLLAYNVSDVVGLSILAEHPTYSSAFDLKIGLLNEYPETIYEKDPNGYFPKISQKTVRRNRLTPDTTSAKFVGLILSPYGDLKDIEAVSFNYPSKRVAEERGIEQRNVLKDCKEFFYQNISSPSARERFDEIYNYYKSIEGKNFNDSKTYQQHYGVDENGTPRTTLPAHTLAEIPKLPNNIPYFNADGTASSCFVTFSTGGIHGAEANVERYLDDAFDVMKWNGILKAIQDMYPDPLDMREAKSVQLTLHNGETIDVDWKKTLTPKSTIKALKARREAIQALGLNPTDEEIQQVIKSDEFKNIGYRPFLELPEVFRFKKESNRPNNRATALDSKYVYTSYGKVIHEDFTSYYPNMLRNMSAFYNPDLGEDRYAKILGDKDRYGKMLKDPTLTKDEKARITTLRNGTKLILNSASGAGDTTHYTPIRMNNNIISMRIIGQLFSWRIGQAQTLAGAKIVSTNTDGLYSMLDEETNNRVLAEQAKLINVEIEPEPLLIVSKDSNNRMEIIKGRDDNWFMMASGGTLGCFDGPNPRKSLAHPAAIDWALARYLRSSLSEFNHEWDLGSNVSVDKPFDYEVGKALLNRIIEEEDPVFAARLFQMTVTASIGKITFPFAADPIENDDDKLTNPRALQHYNRAFFVKTGNPKAVSLHNAGSWVVTPASKAKRKRDGSSSVVSDTVALKICRDNGYVRDQAEADSTGLMLLPTDQDVAVRKISRVERTWAAIIENRDLYHMPENELHDLLHSLDLDVYTGMLEETFTKNWMNPISETKLNNPAYVEVLMTHNYGVITPKAN